MRLRACVVLAVGLCLALLILLPVFVFFASVILLILCQILEYTSTVTPYSQAQCRVQRANNTSYAKVSGSMCVKRWSNLTRTVGEQGDLEQQPQKSLQDN